MTPRNLVPTWEDAACRGVSPVIGVVLLVAIVVVLAATLATTATGFGDDLEEPGSQTAYETEWGLDGADNGDKASFRIVHNAGEAIDGEDVYVVDEAGNEVAWEDVWTADDEATAGEYAHIDGYGSDSALERVCDQREGYTYELVRRTDDSSAILDTYELPRDPKSCP